MRCDTQQSKEIKILPRVIFFDNNQLEKSFTEGFLKLVVVKNYIASRASVVSFADNCYFLACYWMFIGPKHSYTTLLGVSRAPIPAVAIEEQLWHYFTYNICNYLAPGWIVLEVGCCIDTCSDDDWWGESIMMSGSYNHISILKT